MRKIFIVFISFVSSFSALSQEKLGMANSNYSSVNSIFLNPSSSVDSRTLLQFNLIGANIYMMNNLVYMPKFRVWMDKSSDLQDPKLNTSGPFKKFLYSKTEINGPTLVVSNREIGYGFFIRGRVEASVNNIPVELTNLLLEQKIDTVTNIDIDIKNTRISQMAWVEYGVNFGKMYFKHGNKMITVGGNAKYLTGINIAYGNVFRLNAEVNDTKLDIANLRAKIRYNEPGWNTGKGIGVDFGITYKKTLKYLENYYANSPKSNCKYIDYKYKIGISILDLGAIRFTQNTFKGDVSGSTLITDFKHTDLDSVIRSDFNVTQQKNQPIMACLPTAFSAQADFNLGHHFYFNASAVQCLTTSRIIGVQRTNLLSAAIRYERRNFEVAIPLTLHRYIYPQLGFAFRFRTFVLGLDNVLPLVVKSNTYGASVYFNLGISIFKNPACKASKPRYNAPKKNYEGYTFLNLKDKPKRTVTGDGKGEAPGGSGTTKGKKSSKKKGKKKGIFKSRRSKKL
ncbi:MAG: DUF5723 family protein [Bacteroidetes bacterium]|nr:DUF5723 family protein [Bacteroidota bacterium]